MNIGWAVEHLNAGGRVSRAGWNGKGMWLELQKPDAGSKMTEPYVYMKTAQGGLIPWLCSQADLLALDWGPPDEAAPTERNWRGAELPRPEPGGD